MPAWVSRAHETLLVPLEVAEPYSQQLRRVIGIRSGAQEAQLGCDPPVAFQEFLVTFRGKHAGAGSVYLVAGTHPIQAHEVRVGIEDNDLELGLEQQAFENHTKGERLARAGLA